MSKRLKDLRKWQKSWKGFATRKDYGKKQFLRLSNITRHCYFRQENEDLQDSNPPSLESVSSESDNSPTSPASLGNEVVSKVEGLERIEKLEAIIANMTQIGGGPSGAGDNSSTESLGQIQSQHDSLELLTGKKDAESQTLSTGDIVMTKVYNPSSK